MYSFIHQNMCMRAVFPLDWVPALIPIGKKKILFICLLNVKEVTMNIYENAHYGITPKQPAAKSKANSETSKLRW